MTTRKRRPRPGPVSFWFHHVSPIAAEAGPRADESVATYRRRVLRSGEVPLATGSCVPLRSTDVVADARAPFQGAGMCKCWLFCPWCYMRMIHASVPRIITAARSLSYLHLWVAEVDHVLPNDTWSPSRSDLQSRQQIGHFLDRLASPSQCLHLLAPRFSGAVEPLYRQWAIKPAARKAKDPQSIRVSWRFVGVAEQEPKRGRDIRSLPLAGDSFSAISAGVWDLWTQDAGFFDFPAWSSIDPEVYRRLHLTFRAPFSRRFRDLLKPVRSPKETAS